MNSTYSDNNRYQENTWSLMDTILSGARLIIALIGCLLAVSGIYTIYPLTESMKTLSVTSMKISMVFFGATVLLLEGKNCLPEHHDLRKWFYREFRFLQSLRGRGFYYVFVGMLSCGLSVEHAIFFCCGFLIAVMGIFYLAGSLCEGTTYLANRSGINMEDLKTTTGRRPRGHKNKISDKHYPDKVLDTVVDSNVYRDAAFYGHNQLEYDGGYTARNVPLDQENLPHFPRGPNQQFITNDLVGDNHDEREPLVRYKTALEEPPNLQVHWDENEPHRSFYDGNVFYDKLARSDRESAVISYTDPLGRRV